MHTAVSGIMGGRQHSQRRSLQQAEGRLAGLARRVQERGRSLQSRRVSFGVRNAGGGVMEEKRFGA